MNLRKTIGMSLALLVASTPALAKQTAPSQNHHHHPAPHPKLRPAKAEAAARHGATHHAARRKLAERASRRHPTHARSHVAELPPPDQYIGPFKPIGKAQVGAAAWYGGSHLGHRTASGERLDAVHVTAAHRSLPLHSLVRVTNLGNGRSVIATINDRGPFNHRFVIDVSPRAAEELRMLGAGVATVSIQPVAEKSDPAAASAAR